jgi:TolB-like protein/AraC-like DNA-binding protein
MSDLRIIENDFLSQIAAIVEKNISNEQFGVSELADEMNMSRSNLLRKVKKLTNLSVSQLINQIRLKRAMDLLQKSSLNVSEVSHEVGFGSTSYFIKCFREFYGYPPGEAAKRSETDLNAAPARLVSHNGNKKRNFVLAAVAFVTLVAAGLLAYRYLPLSDSSTLEKSIAVLPFKNDSNDSTNVYLINGLMESTLNNLQKIKDLKVISRTSAEKYRNSSRSIPEMAKELNVSYFVEGSGQKVGDQILLNIQLIEAASDKHLWSKQYKREIKDIFALQQEIASNIAEEIRVIITPEEEKRIKKNPTENLEAYDQFLKGKELFFKADRKSMEASIPHFDSAIALDGKFALAYGEAAMVCYYLDIFRPEKKYAAALNHYADKALLLDSRLAESLVAKALFYIQKEEYQLALPYLEKAAEYNPNSILVINFLSEFYNSYTPNSAKYLENALKGVRLDVGSHDSATTSYIYLHLSNAFIQNGFIDESIKYIDKSLAYNPKNPFSGYVSVLFRYARNRDLKLTRELLIKELNKDTTRIDILKEAGKLCYVMRDYESAYRYYQKFDKIRAGQHLDIFKNEDLAIGILLSKMGQREESAKFITSFRQYADTDKSIYHHLDLAMYYAYVNNKQKAVEHLKLFSKEKNYQYWVLLLPDDPVVESIKDDPEFKKAMGEIETNFWNTNKQIREKLEEEGLL